MSSILAWGKSRVGLPPPFIARITKQPHCGHKWPQWPRSTDWSEADDDITTCNFALKCLIPKLLRVTVLLRHYAITARYFTDLSYWHQSYCKSKCFILIILLRQGTLLYFLIGIKATVKASVLFLLRCYTITARYSTLLIGNKATVNASVSFVLHYDAITARYFTLLSYWHQSYCKSKCFILIMLLRQGTLLFFLIGIKATVKASVLFLLRCYTITARYSTLLIGNKATVNASVSFVLHYDAITARYFTLLSYWHQSYCKSKCFILIRLCWYGKVLHSSYWHQSNCKCKCFILITLLRYYGKVLHFSFFLASKDFDFLLMDLFVSANQDGSRLCLYLSFHFVSELALYLTILYGTAN